jgi:hypothetical protein
VHGVSPGSEKKNPQNGVTGAEVPTVYGKTGHIKKMKRVVCSMSLLLDINLNVFDKIMQF